VIAFASQKRQEQSIWPALQAYHKKATGNSYCDYGFHVILTNANETVLQEELPQLVDNEGISSVKIYMTCKHVLSLTRKACAKQPHYANYDRN
jgi:dihydropyrimidinase